LTTILLDKIIIHTGRLTGTKISKFFVALLVMFEFVIHNRVDEPTKLFSDLLKILDKTLQNYSFRVGYDCTEIVSKLYRFPKSHYLA